MQRADRDFNTFRATPVTPVGYSVVNQGAQVILTAADTESLDFALTARDENLLDASYEEVFGFTVPGHGLYLGERIDRVAG